MSTHKRPYRADSRQAKAELNRKRILIAARKAFSTRGFERSTIAGVAEVAGVSVPLIYALFKSKEGLLRALIDSTVFGTDYQALVAKVSTQTDPVNILETAASITRLIYEAELRQMGSLHRAGILSAGLRRLEQELERQRYERQEVVVRRLAQAAAIRPGLSVAKARDILWCLTSGDIYRMLVLERKWTGDAYQAWLGTLLARALLNSATEQS